MQRIYIFSIRYDTNEKHELARALILIRFYYFSKSSVWDNNEATVMKRIWNKPQPKNIKLIWIFNSVTS